MENRGKSKTNENFLIGLQRFGMFVHLYIQNIFEEGELIEREVCAKFAHTTKHGAMRGKTQTTEIVSYNLDVIISVGYRVKSKQGTRFRQWANRVLKEYLLKGYVLNQRIEAVEKFAIETETPLVEGIYAPIAATLFPYYK